MQPTNFGLGTPRSKIPSLSSSLSTSKLKNSLAGDLVILQGIEEFSRQVSAQNSVFQVLLHPVQGKVMAKLEVK